MSPEQIQALADTIDELVKFRLRELEERVAALEGLWTAVERSAGDALQTRFRGAWRKGELYQRNNTIYHEGCLYTAEFASENKIPSTHPECWRCHGRREERTLAAVA